MKLSTRSRYGVRLMTRLAAGWGRGATLMRDIARAEGISAKYLGQIVIPLRGAGLVSGQRGSGGGYVLGRAPDQITLREIVEVLEGDLSVVPCTADPASCKRFETCGATTLWQQVATDIRNRLSSWTLADLAAQWRGKQRVGADYEI